jgi:hypothetical protein
MAMIFVSEIAGICKLPEVVCTNCCTDNDWAAAREVDLIMLRYVEKHDPLFFCDRCKEKLPVEEIINSSPK